jgi:hypothetical protein
VGGGNLTECCLRIGGRTGRGFAQDTINLGLFESGHARRKGADVMGGAFDHEAPLLMRAPVIRVPCMMGISAPGLVAEPARAIRGARADRSGSSGLCGGGSSLGGGALLCC